MFLHFRKKSTVSTSGYVLKFMLLHLIFCVITIISPQYMHVPNRPPKLYFLKYHKDFSRDQVKVYEICGVCGMHGVEKKCA